LASEPFLSAKACRVSAFLIVDGHSSLMNIEVLEFAASFQITILCLPSHTTQFLQPLDRSFFKTVKQYFGDACSHWVLAHRDRKLNMVYIHKAATQKIGTNGFKACVIFLFNKSAIPNHAYSKNSRSYKINAVTKNVSIFTFTTYLTINLEQK
jgi:hypothetical protein